MYKRVVPNLISLEREDRVLCTCATYPGAISSTCVTAHKHAHVQAAQTGVREGQEGRR